MYDQRFQLDRQPRGLQALMGGNLPAQQFHGPQMGGPAPSYQMPMGGYGQPQPMTGGNMPAMQSAPQQFTPLGSHLTQPQQFSSPGQFGNGGLYRMMGMRHGAY